MCASRVDVSLDDHGRRTPLPHAAHVDELKTGAVCVRKMIQEMLDRCSDAVLLLGDGNTVPCSRFVIMTECSVLRVMTEADPVMDQMDRRDNKYVIPIADTGVVKYTNFCAVVHGAAPVTSLSFEDAVDVFDAARRLGAEKLQNDALRQAWRRAPDMKHAFAADIVADLLVQDEPFVLKIVEHAAKEYPLWVDIETEFLDNLKHLTADKRIIKAILTLQFHYPPSSVAKWLLTNIENPTEDVVLRIMTANSHLYCPTENRPVYAEASKWYTVNGTWSRDVHRLLQSIMESTAWSNQIPPAPGGAHGTHVEFEDLPRTFMSVAFPANRVHGKKPVQLGPCVRVRMPKGSMRFGFDVHAGRVGAPNFEVHITASRRMSLLTPFFEAWYSFSDVSPGMGWMEAESSSHLITSHGLDAADTELAETRTAAYVRFDVRYAKKCALSHPFE